MAELILSVLESKEVNFNAQSIAVNTSPKAFEAVEGLLAIA